MSELTQTRESRAKKMASFEAIVHPVVEWMEENQDPHCMIIIDDVSAKLFKGLVSIQFAETHYAAHYAQGVCGDGVAILKDGKQMTIEQILIELRKRNNHE